jgi:hypothetical protein
MHPCEALALQERSAGHPCAHPHLEEEDPINGQSSGDWVCTTCGLTAPRETLERRLDTCT